MTVRRSRCATCPFDTRLSLDELAGIASIDVRQMICHEEHPSGATEGEDVVLCRGAHECRLKAAKIAFRVAVRS